MSQTKIANFITCLLLQNDTQNLCSFYLKTLALSLILQVLFPKVSSFFEGIVRGFWSIEDVKSRLELDSSVLLLLWCGWCSIIAQNWPTNHLIILAGCLMNLNPGRFAFSSLTGYPWVTLWNEGKSSKFNSLDTGQGQHVFGCFFFFILIQVYVIVNLICYWPSCALCWSEVSGRPQWSFPDASSSPGWGAPTVSACFGRRGFMFMKQVCSLQ